jgi:predicted flap endonuclease-1-like 5' DNA nuclease
MSEATTKTPKIWLISAICGVLAFLALLWIAGYATTAAIIVGVLVTFLVAILLWIGWHEEETTPVEGHPEADVRAEGLMATASIGDEPISVAEEIAPEPHAADTREVRSAAAAAAPAADPVAEEPEEETAKPTLLKAPLEGGANDLKQIKGVGPKLEVLLHSMGVYHFGQIAGWSAAEVAWMDENLQGFKGRVTRDDWVGQAKALSEGEETEFSKRVKDGDVY